MAVSDSGRPAVAARSQGPGMRTSESLRPMRIWRNVKRGRLTGPEARPAIGACAERLLAGPVRRSARQPRHAPRPSIVINGFCREAPMPDDPKPAPRRPIPPLMDHLGELCKAGSDSATYL